MLVWLKDKEINRKSRRELKKTKKQNGFQKEKYVVLQDTLNEGKNLNTLSSS